MSRTWCYFLAGVLATNYGARFLSSFGVEALVVTRGGRRNPMRTFPMRATVEETTGVSLMEGYTAGATLSLKDVSVGIADNTLISNLNWNILPNERWAIVGTNGCGKSTLLKSITGTKPEFIMEGKVTVMPGVRLGYLEQTAVSGAKTSVKSEVMSRMVEYQAALTELEAAEKDCTEGTPEQLARMESAQNAFEAAGGYTVDQRVSLVLQGLGFETADYDQPCDAFSGGWQMRIALARLLLSEPELLILDEPTNHLDASARKWLGNYVGNYQGTVVLVSHDLEMLKVACNSIAEVRGGEVQLYKTMGYDKFLTEREERAARAMAEWQAMERERAKMQDFVDRMGAKASKATQAQDRIKKLAKLEEQMKMPAWVDEATTGGAGKAPHLSLAAPPPCGQWPVQLQGASFGYAAAPTDDGTLIPATVPELCVVKDVDLKVTKGMRLLIRGPNGAGKSTLLKAITGALPLASGTRTTDDRLSLGLFAQDLAQELPGETAAVDYVTDVVRRYDALIPDTLARSVMGALGLTGPKATRPIGTLSGGEKARVALATFCLTPHNLLLLDEPTNHLDQGAIESLLDALERYEGAVLVVSHDRSFCEAVKCTHVAYVSGGTCTVEERSLRESDWSETDKGHRALRPPVGSPEEAALLEATAAAVAAAKAQQAKAAAEAEAAAALKAAAPPPPTAAKPKYVPEQKKKKAAVFADASSGDMPSVMQVSAAAAAAASQEAPAHYSAAKAKKDLERFEKDEKAAKGAKPLNKKQAKLIRDEYAGIEAAVEQCDAEALVAEQALADGKVQRLTFSQISELALAASAARRVAEQKMARWMELEEIMETLPSE